MFLLSYSCCPVCRACGTPGLSMQEIPIVSGFTAGELTPWLDSRFDLQAYQRGAAEITNFQILPYGGIQLRPGTQYAGTLSTGHVRLVPFYYAESDTLLLLFQPGSMRVYKNGQCLTNADGSVYEFTTPWSKAEELELLHFNQVNDAVYVCCPGCPVSVLYRYADTSWSCLQPNLDVVPREQYSQQEGRLSVIFDSDGKNADLVISGGKQKFSKSMENAEIVLADATVPGRVLFANSVMETKAKAAADISKNAVSKGTVCYQADSTSKFNYFYRCIRAYGVGDYNGSSNMGDYPHFFLPGIMRLDSNGKPYEVQRDWELTTAGTWNAHWELWRSYDTPETESDFYLWNWTCIKTFSQSDFGTRQNWALSGSEERPCRMVLVCRCCTDPEYLGAMVAFKVMGGTREYRMRITSVSGENNARARVERSYLGAPVSFSTKNWSFGAIGSRNGYPAFSAMFQGRLWLGGMPGLPTTLLASAVDDFLNFGVGSNDDAAMHLSLMGSDQSRICWLCATRQLLIGSSDSEWCLSSSAGNVITPTTAAFRRQSSVGSESMPARAVENTVLFVQRGGRRMREIAYRLESDGFSATDISMLAEHLFASGVKEWCIQRGANFNIWVLMQDHSLAVLTINLEQQVTAWQRVVFAGRKVLTMAAVQSTIGKDDEMWFVVQMQAGGAFVLERMCSDSPHLDCMEVVTAAQDGTLPRGAHLSGAGLVVVNADTNEAVSGSGEQLPVVQRGLRYQVGIPIEASLRTMPLESSVSFNSVRQFSRFRLRLLNSDDCFAYRSSAAPGWEQFAGGQWPFTGAVRLSQMPDAAVGQSLCIRYTGHRDFRLLAISQEVDHHGK